MNIPDIDNWSRSQSISDDFSRFQAVLFQATRTPQLRVEPSPEETSDISATRSILRSYKFVTESAVSGSSSSRSNYSLPTSASSEATHRKENSLQSEDSQSTSASSQVTRRKENSLQSEHSQFTSASSQATRRKENSLQSEHSQSTSASSQTTSWKESSRSVILQGSSDILSKDYDSRPDNVSYPGRGPSAAHPFTRLGRGNRIENKIRVAKPDDTGPVQPTTTEVWGWLLCDVGICGFKAALWVFFPLLIFSLFAASRSFMDGKGTVADAVHCPYNVTDRDPRCLKVCDSFTEDLTSWTTDSLGGNATRSSGVTILEILSTRSWQPALLITAMLGASVVIQLLQFTVTSPLLDYSKYPSFLLWLGAGTGVVASAITINLFRAEWWWIGGILFLFSTVSVGLLSTWLDSHLSSLASGVPILKTRLFDEVQIFQSVRIRFIYKVSLTGSSFGCLSTALCTLAAYFFLRSSLVPKLMGSDPNNWSLRIACCIGGIWLFSWTVISSAFFLKDRPGPGLKYIPHPATKHLLMAVLGLRIGQAGKGRSGLLLLLICFLSSMGNATVFHAGFLCFSPRNFIRFAVVSQVSSLAGSILFLVVQIALSWSNKVMMLIALLLHLLLPIYACLGLFFNATSRRTSKLLGLNTEWEFLIFAFAYGVCLGAHRSYIRALFIACIPTCIPAPTLVGAYFSLLALVNQFSTFVGSIEVFLFVSYNGDLRYTFVVMAVALLLASILMVFVTITKQQDFEAGSSTDISLYQDANMIKSSVEVSSKSNSDNYAVHVPLSLRTQYAHVQTMTLER